MSVDVKVDAPYPCWVTFRVNGNHALRMTHRDLLQWEQAIALAKQQVLAKLPRRDWHEVDPRLAQDIEESYD